MVSPFHGSNNFLSNNFQQLDKLAEEVLGEEGLVGEEGLNDFFSSNGELNESVTLHYFDAPKELSKLNIKPLNLKKNPDRLTALADEKRLVFVTSNANKQFEFKLNPSLADAYRNITQINFEDEFGVVRTLRNDGNEQNFVIKAQSQAEMMAIARAVNQISLKILKDKKKNADHANELKSEHKEISIESSYEPKINLKKAHIQEIAPNESKTTDITCQTFKATLKSQEDMGQTIHKKKHKASEELAEETELHHKIIAKEVTHYELNKKNVDEDYLKTTQRVEKLHETEALIPEIVNADR